MTQHQEHSYADYMETAPAPESAPVAVTVIGSTPLPIQDRPTRKWSTGQIHCGPELAQQLAGGHPSRVRLTVKNLTATPVYLAPDQHSCTPTSGYPLAEGERVEFTTRHPVYALGEAAGALVAVIAEHLDG